MLHIANAADAPLPGATASRGGFAWWYADLVDAQGNGVVLIPAWGLPFLPGYTAAARAGEAPPAHRRPSVAIAVYEGGRCAYYLLQEIAPDRARREGHVLHFGDSTFAFANGALDASLDLDAPGGRLRGSVTVRGTPRLAVTGSPLAHEGHEWCPLTGPATGQWSLRVGERRFAGEGSAYLDRNAGRAHLEALGVMRWTWARAVLPDRLRIAYALFDAEDRVHAALVDVHTDGRTEALPATVSWGRTRRNLWGLAWWPSLTVHAEERSMRLDVLHRPDDGPFYQRSVVEAHTERGRATGIAEVCDSRRIDRAWQRPLVEMCVHRPHGASSMWLPLFAGPREGRLGRLLGGT